MCNLMLAIAYLSFVLPEADAALLSAGPAQVRTCLNETCWDTDVDVSGPESFLWMYDAAERKLSIQQWEPVDGGTDGDRRAVVPGAPPNSVSLTVSRDGQELFSHSWADVKFNESEPNGEGCGVHYSADPLSY